MNRSWKYRRGRIVEVRIHGEILATLDAEGKLQGLPFMPEMAKYCGRRFKIYRRAERVFLDHWYYVAGLKQTVLLEDVRCDGTAHGGCEMGCLLLWKEAWLEPVGQLEGGDTGRPATDSPCRCQLPAAEQGRFCCQATELVNATSPIPWWDFRQYFRDLVSGQMTLRQTAGMLMLLCYNKVQRWRGRTPYGYIGGQQRRTPVQSLDLQPGELVEVKTRAEIGETLDPSGRNRGLGFVTDMAAYCGKRYRVGHRVERVVIEWSGELLELKNTVTLEGVTCSGLAFRGCPRNCHHLWREIWLKRVS